MISRIFTYFKMRREFNTKRNENFAEAFSYLRRNAGIRFQYEVSDRMNMSKDTITRVLRGYTEATDDFLDKFNAAFGDIFNYQWLRGNSEIMLAKDVKPEPKPQPRTEAEGAVTLLELYTTLIKEVESIRRDLNTQMQRTIQLNAQLESQIARMEKLGIPAVPTIGTDIATNSPTIGTDPIIPSPNLRAAEPSPNPSEQPTDQAQETTEKTPTKRQRKQK